MTRCLECDCRITDDGCACDDKRRERAQLAEENERLRETLALSDWRACLAANFVCAAALSQIVESLEGYQDEYGSYSSCLTDWWRVFQAED